MTATTATTDTLRAGLATLLQELFDIIHDLTFTAAPSGLNITANTTSAELFPHLLHVPREARKQFADSYYSNTIFKFDRPEQCANWRSIFMVDGYDSMAVALGNVWAGGLRVGPRPVVCPCMSMMADVW